MVKDAKTGAVVQQGFYLWHAGTHSWVTPEYIKVHGEAAAGLPTGSAVDLTQLKDKNQNLKNLLYIHERDTAIKTLDAG